MVGDKHYFKGSVEFQFKSHSDFSKSFLTRGLSPLPLYILENEQLMLSDSAKKLIIKTCMGQSFCRVNYLCETKEEAR